jgi:CubicO group peptidase (beta-lactamase class C family)
MAFDKRRLERLDATLVAHAESGAIGGLAWLAACGDDVHVGTAGVLTRGNAAPIARDSIFRIASMTKPIVAAAAMILVEECRLRLEDPVDGLLPELADRRVLVDGAGPVDGPTVPALRPITVRDVLTFELGLGMDFTAPWPQPMLDAMEALELGSGPPNPAGPPPPDEWMRRLATLPLMYQPGERWLYNTGADVLGVLVARAAGQPLEAFLRDRLFDPLGMRDTAFFTADTDRLGTCYTTNPETGAKEAFDGPDGQWAKPPAFPSGGGGMVSTVDDIYAFARMLQRGGRAPDGSALLSRAAVSAMTKNQIEVVRGASGPSLDGSSGWGFGVGVTVRRTGLGPNAGAYGWAGGLGSSWSNDPAVSLIGAILTTDAFTGPFPPPAVIQDFWTCVYGALE